MIKIERILCPCDYSEASRRGLSHANEIARWFGASVKVVHVQPAPAPVLASTPVALAGAVPVPSLATAVAESAQGLRRDLERFVAQAADGGDVEVTSELEWGDPVQAILEHVESEHADLVVMGTHGRSGIERLVLGSVAEEVLRKAPCPVFTVGPGEECTVRPRRVLCPTDFSDSARDALAWALAWAAKVDATLQVVHVADVLLTPAPVASFAAGEELEMERERTKARLDDLLTEVGGEHRVSCHPPVERTVVPGEAHREIVRLASEDGADLIVMGVHGQGLVDRMLFGSTTIRVVRAARCPVLSVRRAPGLAPSIKPG